jgi:hypothetical protein
MPAIPLLPFAAVHHTPIHKATNQTHTTFNKKGLITSFTMGYAMDRRVGNTGGLGGAFGLLAAVGVPFPYPEGHSWASSWQQRVRICSLLGDAARCCSRACALCFYNYQPYC